MGHRIIVGKRFIDGGQVQINIAQALSFNLSFSYYLQIIAPLLKGQAVDFEGEQLTAKLALDIPDAESVPLLVAALGYRFYNPTLKSLRASHHLRAQATRLEGPLFLAPNNF